jgi:glycosyltransferase involved in cell wall biosynthesis
MGLFFYPRGGSAQVAGYLARALAAHGWRVTLACGSLGARGALGNAATVFAGLDIVPAEYDDAVARWERGEDPMDAPFPMHPSYEARADVPDRAFPWVSPAQSERMASAWARLIGGSRALSRARLLHLHHVTPLHDAAARALPGVPVVTHLHGTELKMLDAIARARPDMSEGPHARWWASHMQRAARRAVATITISPYDRGEAVRLLGLDPATVHWIANGVDVERFAGHRPSGEERRSHWLRWLVHDPQGWDEATGTPGSVRYAEDEVLDAFFDAASGRPQPVLMFVGRFLGFKRVPLLVRAYACARRQMSEPAPLVVWGGVPGEWEGEHPHTVATREQVEGVFFTGWRGHDQLPLGLNCADCFVAPSTDEPFGLVYLEAMACELPVIATLSGGPPSFVNVVQGEPDGWLVPPDDEAALTEAMVTAVEAVAERTRRGANAGRHAREGYSWESTAGRVAALYDSHASRRRGRGRRHSSLERR